MSLELDPLSYPFYLKSQATPDKKGTTKGTYLTGFLYLPPTWSPGQEVTLGLSCQDSQQEVEGAHVHPCLVHLVYISSKGSRDREHEPRPDFSKRVRELVVKSDLKVLDGETNREVATVTQAGGKWRIGLGGDKENLHINIICPKTRSIDSGQGNIQESELRAAIRRDLERDTWVVEEEEKEKIVENLEKYYTEYYSANLNTLRIRAEFLMANQIFVAVSDVIHSKKYKMTSVILERPNILKSCTEGSRRIMLVSQVTRPQGHKADNPS